MTEPTPEPRTAEERLATLRKDVLRHREHLIESFAGLPLVHRMLIGAVILDLKTAVEYSHE